MKHTIKAALLVCGLASSAHATTIFYEFTGSTSGPTATTATGSVPIEATGSTMTSGAFTNGAGGTAALSTALDSIFIRTHNTAGTTIADAIANDAYASFTITAGPNNDYALSEINWSSFTSRPSAGGTFFRVYAFQESQGFNAGDELGFTESTFTGTNGQSPVVSSGATALTGTVAAGTTEEFRFYYVDDADSSAVISRLGAFSIAGTEIAPIPEPSSTALLGLGGLALILRRRK